MFVFENVSWIQPKHIPINSKSLMDYIQAYSDQSEHYISTKTCSSRKSKFSCISFLNMIPPLNASNSTIINRLSLHYWHTLAPYPSMHLMHISTSNLHPISSNTNPLNQVQCVCLSVTLTFNGALLEFQQRDESN